MGPPHEGSIRRSIAPGANALTTELHLAPVPVGDLVSISYVDNYVAAAGFLSRYLSGPLPYVRRHITVNKMC